MAFGERKEKILISPNPSASLSESLRDDLQALLFDRNKIKDLSSTLDKSCQAVGWQTKVEERALQLLRSGELKSYRELERTIVAEALGKHVLEGSEADVRGGSSGRKTTEPATDIKFPDSAAKEGTKLVRDVIEGSVDIRREQIEDEEWKDWR